MSTYLLVHGAWMSSWGWHKVTPLLEQAGHHVVMLDLPAHGEDQTPVPQASLQAYTDAVVQLLDQQAEPVILVGHSMAGTVISQVAEARPDKIKTLVYLTAYLLPNGGTLFAASQQDTGSQTSTILDVQPDQGLIGLQTEGMKTVFLNGCSDEDIREALAHYRPDPIAPLATPITISEANFGRVPRVYIHCLQDQVISPAFQEQMYTELPCQQVLTLEAGHAGFLSRPVELVAHLTSL